MVKMKKPEDRKINVNTSLSPDLVIEINNISGEFSRSATIESMLRDHIAQLKNSKPVQGTRGRTALLTIALDEAVLADLLEYKIEGISLSSAIEHIIKQCIAAVDEADDAEDDALAADPHPIYG
ncbi:hypothetical protein FXW07_07215 [Methanosarcina sp. DH1]|uniref:hypothetical protein n=1 Tax=Methanosarcina sp. DH1 TaxID=2605695 RepID=UPI001E2BAF71|nr:hypothetical protein [Methanosarcina sp. DH1]MCC4766409.1 hypothetical protein [Methanosarcina sp. DH1]